MLGYKYEYHQRKVIILQDDGKNERHIIELGDAERALVA